MLRTLHSLALFLCITTPFVSGSRLGPRAAQPSPISIEIAQNWDDDDGPWSTFALRLGDPIQNVRVLISTTLADTWVVRSDGCQSSQKTCKEDRGRTFDPAQSRTWKQLGNASLSVNQNLGPYVDGVAGNETLGMGFQGSGGPVLQQQSVVAYTSPDLNVGMFGLNPWALSLDAKARGQQSFLAGLKNKSMIPSLSFGYTAGNQYVLKKFYGSLTLGGYDQTIANPLPLDIPFTGNDPSRLLQVNLQSISVREQGGKVTPLLPKPVLANVDSTASMIWLPLEACRAFESAFGLKWDEKAGLYLVDDDTHSQLQQNNASVTFTITNPTAGGKARDIVLSYSAFDLLVKPPFSGINKDQQYFPLRRAANESQYTLGRTFLQESYLTVDWDRRKFSISQCNFTEAPKKLVSIYAPGQGPPSGPGRGAKIGIAVGTIVGLLLLIALISIYLLRRRRAHRRALEEASKTGINPKETMIRQGLAKGEMDTGLENLRLEMEGSDGNALRPYGGHTPTWVNEKARYPGLSSPDVAEVDGSERRAELGGAIGFYGGRGVHELYDPSSVPPIELPTASSEATLWSDRPNKRTKSGKRSRGSSVSTPISSDNPHSGRSSFFGFLRRSRAELGETDRSTDVGGSSSPPPPKGAEKAFDSRARARRIPNRQMHGKSASSDADALVSSPDTPSTVPERTLRGKRPSQGSAVPRQSLPSDYKHPRVPTSAHFANRESGSQVSHRSLGPGSPGPSAPSSPSSPQQYGKSSRKNHRMISSPETSNSEDTFSPLSRQGTFSGPSRQGTGDILSPISPEEDTSDGYRNRGYFGGFSRY